VSALAAAGLVGVSPVFAACTSSCLFQLHIPGLQGSGLDNSSSGSTITVSLAGATLPAGTVGTAYTFDFTTLLNVSGDPNYTATAVTCGLASGSLPAGLSLTPGCSLTGTPTTSVSNQSFSVAAQYRGVQGTGSYALTINQAPFVFSPTLASTATNYNVYSAAQAAGWNGTAPLQATVTVPSGGVLGATSTSGYAFLTGTGFPTGSRITLVNNGTIVGAGGAGGSASAGGGTGAVGNAGGSALYVQFPLTVTNNGTIAGGGGGGGAAVTSWEDSVVAGGSGGGGGQGYGTSAGGGFYVDTVYPPGYSGGTGSLSAPGAGGAATESGRYPNQNSAPWYCFSGAAGQGGALGQPGSASAVSSGSGCTGAGLSNPGGAAGYSVVGASNVTWSTTGTVKGPQQ
jgi:hypothetical protein